MKVILCELLTCMLLVFVPTAGQSAPLPAADQDLADGECGIALPLSFVTGRIHEIVASRAPAAVGYIETSLSVQLGNDDTTN